MEPAQPPWVSSALDELGSVTLPSLCAFHQEVYGTENVAMVMAAWEQARGWVETRMRQVDREVLGGEDEGEEAKREKVLGVH